MEVAENTLKLSNGEGYFNWAHSTSQKDPPTTKTIIKAWAQENNQIGQEISSYSMLYWIRLYTEL